MTRKDIITLPNPKLRETSRRVGLIDENIQKLVQDMVSAANDWEQHRDHEVAAALAAVQVGQTYRVAIIRDEFSDSEEAGGYFALINPEIVKTEGEPVVDTEGCLSVKDIYGSVPRYPKVKVKARALDGQEVRFSAEGHLARVLQHEIDHMKGKLFIDTADKQSLSKMDAGGKLLQLSEEEIEQLDIS